MSVVVAPLLVVAVVVVVVVVAMTTTVVVVDAGTNDAGIAFLKENKLKDEVIELPSGLQYKILRNGTGIYSPGLRTICACHYTGQLIDGSIFDTSYDDIDRPISFSPSQVIDGWKEIMQLMVEGDKYELYIPSELGYGDEGDEPEIPGGSVLVFQMEIIEIRHDKYNEKKVRLKCNALSPNFEGCNDDEKSYIESMMKLQKDVGHEQLEFEYDKMKRMLSYLPGMSKESAEIGQRRYNILKQIMGITDEEEKEQELQYQQEVEQEDEDTNEEL